MKHGDILNIKWCQGFLREQHHWVCQRCPFFCGGVLGITLEKGLNMMDLFSSTGLLGRLRGGIHRKPRSSFEAVLFCVEFVHPNAAVRSI